MWLIGEAFRAVVSASHASHREHLVERDVCRVQEQRYSRAWRHWRARAMFILVGSESASDRQRKTSERLLRIRGWKRSRSQYVNVACPFFSFLFSRLLVKRPHQLHCHLHARIDNHIFPASFKSGRTASERILMCREHRETEGKPFAGTTRNNA
jgi:hypothetical protein